MSVAGILIEETSKLMQLGIEDRKRLLCALGNCKSSGLVDICAVRQFAESGFPLMQIFATINHISIQESSKAFQNNEVTYEDLACLIGIFAQDIKLRSQYGK